MPFIHMMTNVPVSEAAEKAMKEAFGKAISIIPGKSEQWLMVDIEGEHRLYLAGSGEPAAMVEVSLYGSAAGGTYNKLTGAVTETVVKNLGIDPARVYVKYAETPYWGWNGENF